MGGAENGRHPSRGPMSKGGEKGCTGEREGPLRLEFSSPASYFTVGEIEAERDSILVIHSASQPFLPSTHIY